MQRVLVICGSASGASGRFARALGDQLRRRGTGVDVLSPTDTGPDPECYDGIIVTGLGQSRMSVLRLRRWLRGHAAAVAGKPTVIVAVSDATSAIEQSPSHDETERLAQDVLAMLSGTPAARSRMRLPIPAA